MPYDKKQLAEKYEALPHELQVAISSAEVSEKIQAIGTAHKLLLDKIDELIEEAALVMLGINKPETFANSVSKRLGIDSLEAQKIVNDINNEVFLPIKDHLMKLHYGTSPSSSNSHEVEHRDEMIKAIENPESIQTPGITRSIDPHPAIKPGETAHDAPHVETAPAAQPTPPPVTPAPATFSPSGDIISQKLNSVVGKPPEEKRVDTPQYKKDPYREPFE